MSTADAPETTAAIPAELLDDMRAFAATLRGSQAVGALRLIEHFDPDAAPAHAPAADFCAHGAPIDAHCGGCETESRVAHPVELRTFTNPDTLRKTVRCHRCRLYRSNYYHTGGEHTA